MRIKTIFAIVSCFFIITGLITSLAVAGALTPNPALTQDGVGLNFAAEGIGLESLGAGTANISINIGGPVQAAYLYWAGRARPCDTDGTVQCIIPSEPYEDQELIFDGNPITGDIAGFESQLDTSLLLTGQDINNIGYLADATAIVQAKGAGLQTFAIQDGDPGSNLFRLNGAALIVLYRDLADPVSYRVMVYDGLDFAFGRDDQIPEAQVTTPVNFNHEATGNDRTAQLVIFNGDATPERPDRIDVTDAFGAMDQFVNQLVSGAGDSWDVFKTDITIPANGGTTTVQLFSEPFGENPDSLLWEVGALRVPLPGVPEIELLKQVSLTGGEPFFDADTPESAPVGEIGADATYRLIVRNVGTETLVNLRITDPTLGLLNVPVPGGPLAPGDERVITSSDTGFESLFFEDRCDSAGDKLNVAQVDAEGEDTGAPVSDDDPAVVRCNPPEEALGCRLTGGLNATFDTGDGINRYTSGGQVGANTGAQPQPKGEWTHTQHEGPAGDFTFRGGTSSAPEGSEIDAIRCSDPGGCKPSGNPPSPVKQLDFDGIGTFKNIGKDDKVPDFVTAGANVTAEGNGNKNFDGTYHWFEVNIDDLGEPGNTNPKKNPGDVDPELCPSIGFGEKGEPGTENSAICECSDFYRITIYDGVNAEDIVKNPDGSIDPGQLNRTDVIYEVWGPIDGGNYQIHGPTGFDRKSE